MRPLIQRAANGVLEPEAPMFWDVLNVRSPAALLSTM